MIKLASDWQLDAFAKPLLFQRNRLMTAAIPFLKDMYRKKFSRGKLKGTARAPFKYPMTVEYLKKHAQLIRTGLVLGSS